ncbi:TonB-dependent receptor plug domain-containing protein [Duganella qianjiadongensis]|uniref:TonB-dependent receptor n=1 Tax=Duganella qianjiadongensis TaxID=2692176 RepID=A0ABW9VEB8_9BURK|nr:TonB-dependent receptor [Duganella qianjiadongensis]MYM37964.1 TonB-dependent receptor [Duganella qianjiadongensis]
MSSNLHTPHPLRLKALTVAVSLACCAPAYAEESAGSSAAAASAASVTEASVVVVTGSRVGGRTIENSASPIDVLTQEDLANSGASNLLGALVTLIPSFNLPGQSPQPDLGSIVLGVQQRNLSPSYTLVLINGKRRNTTAVVNENGFSGSAAVDLGLIPISAIDHVEVLRDGASALYGSAAIAGTVNVILKRNAQGGQIGLSGGATTKGDGENGSVALNQGFALDERGFVSLFAQLSKQKPAVRSSPLNAGYLYYPAIKADGSLSTTLGPNNALPAGATPNPKEAGRDYAPWKNSGQKLDVRTSSVGYNAEYDLGNDLSAYSFATYSDRRAYSAQNFRSPFAIYSNTNARNNGWFNFYPDGFTPQESTADREAQLVAGLRGVWGGWNWDLSSNYGRDKVEVFTVHSANYALPAAAGQTDFNIGQHIYSLWTNTLDLTRSIATGWSAKPLNLSAGLEYTSEHSQLKAGEPNAYLGVIPGDGGNGSGGAQSLPGYLPRDAADTKRHGYAAYAGAGTNLTEAWFIDGGVRGEHYSDFGSSGLIGKLSSRYDFSPALALRGTASNGFHAPSLQTVSFSNTSGRPNGLISSLVRPDSAAGQALGAVALAPEKAQGFTLGLTGDLGTQFNYAVDFYQTEVKHTLGTSANVGLDRTNSDGQFRDATGAVLSPSQLAILQGYFTAAGLAIPQQGTGLTAHYFTDVGDVRSRGVDLTIDGKHKLDTGVFKWNLAANFNTSAFTRLSDIPAKLKGLPNISTLSLTNQQSTLYLAPSDKQVLSLNYKQGAYSLDLRETRIGKVRRFWTNADNAALGLPTTGEWNAGKLWTTDLTLGWNLGHGFDAKFAVVNAFNQRARRVPDISRTNAAKAQYQYAYDTSGPLGADLGSQYYATLNYKF